MIFVHITSNRGRLAAFSKRAHEPFYRIVCYVATLSLSVTSRAASLQCIRNFSRITTEINIVNTVQENFGCCELILGSIWTKWITSGSPFSSLGTQNQKAQQQNRRKVITIFICDFTRSFVINHWVKMASLCSQSKSVFTKHRILIRCVSPSLLVTAKRPLLLVICTNSMIK